MPAGHCFGLVNNSLLCLDVRISGAFFATLGTTRIQHKLGEVEITRIAGNAVQLGESHFNDLVAGPDFLLARTKGAVEQIRSAEGDVQKCSLAGGLIVRHGRFIEMAQVVQLVAVHSFKNPALIAGPRMWMRRIDGACSIEIAVLFLRRADLRDQVVDIRFKLRIGRILVVLEWLAPKRFRGADKIVDASSLFILFEGERNGHRAINLDARRPEFVVHMDRREGDWFYRVVAVLGPHSLANEQPCYRYCNRFHKFLL